MDFRKFQSVAMLLVLKHKQWIDDNRDRLNKEEGLRKLVAQRLKDLEEKNGS